MTRKETSGFTLLELLIVVIIVGILAAVAIPQFGKATRKARAAEATATVGAYLSAEMAYYQENGLYENAAKTNLLVTEPTGGRFGYALTGTTSAPIMTATGIATDATVSGITVTGTVDTSGKKTITTAGL